MSGKMMSTQRSLVYVWLDDEYTEKAGMSG